MINLTLVTNHNTSPDGATSVGLLQEWCSHYNSYLEELTPYHRDVYQIISETTMRSYFFPFNAMPWHSDYYGSIDFLDMQGKQVGIDEVRKHVSSSQRRERTTWLMDYAFNQMIGRMSQ